jgi:NADPH2:quinone reductase
MKAIRVEATGGPEALKLSDVEKPELKPGHVLVKVEAAGVNFIDIYHRTGPYKLPTPFTPGLEMAGTIEAVAGDVQGFKPGQRVASASALGSYAEYVVAPAAQIVAVPEGVDSKVAGASMLQGMTAHYLMHSTYSLKAGETCLIHAAAGGTGLILTQIASMIGARVIGTTSTREKAEAARQAGAADMILYTESDFEAEVKRLTGGKGVDVVYDSVGKDTFEKSMNCLRPRGMMVTFGNASGAVDPVSPLALTQRGSIFLARPKLADYIASPDEFRWRAGDILGWIAAGKLKIKTDREYPLSDAARAQTDLASRATSGKLLLIP